VEHVQVLIVGGGIAGMSAAIWCERLGLSCVLVEQEQQLGGQLSKIHNEIWDFPPCVYPNGSALLDAFYRHKTIRSLSPRLGEALLHVDHDSHVVTTSKQTYRCDYLIVATGAQPNRIPALAPCARVLSPWFSTTAQAERVLGQDIAIIGGGDRAVESACNLSPLARQIFLLVRRPHFRARPQWVEQLRSRTNVQVFYETEIVACSERENKAELTLRTGRGLETLTVDWVLPRIGVRGNSDGLSLPTFGDGYLQTNADQVTGADWIYAIGDVANGASYASLSLAAGQAMKAVKHISLQIKET
jgi:thioredoxin reductase (NADPH)